MSVSRMWELEAGDQWLKIRKFNSRNYVNVNYLNEQKLLHKYKELETNNKHRLQILTSLQKLLLTFTNKCMFFNKHYYRQQIVCYNISKVLAYKGSVMVGAYSVPLTTLTSLVPIKTVEVLIQGLSSAMWPRSQKAIWLSHWGPQH